MPLTPIKISVFYYKHDGHIPQNFYYSDDIDEIWGLGENEYPGLTKVLLSSNLFIPIDIERFHTPNLLRFHE